MTTEQLQAKKSNRRGSSPGGPMAKELILSSLGFQSASGLWPHILGETRTRILLWYVLILGLVFLAGIPAFRYLLFKRIDAEVHRNITEEMSTFQAMIRDRDLFLKNIEEHDPENLEDLQEYVQLTQSLVVPPRSREDLDEFFDRYLRHSVPEEHTFLLTFLDGEFNKSSPRGRPKPLQKDSDLIHFWGSQTRPTQSAEKVKTEQLGTLLYMLEPIYIDGRVRGVFVVAHATAGEQAEIFEAVLVIIQVSLILFFIALLLTWFAAGRILAPLRTMTATAQTISETDLSQRLPVQGQGELGTLAATFNSMMDRLEVAFGSQREFVNDAGHELRTPITVIQGNLELMGDDPQEQSETLALVMGELDRMGRLVNDMILLAKAERTDFLHLAVVDAGELTEELFQKVQALAPRDWQLDETAQGMVVIDRERITEAVMNLAANATQYTQPGQVISLGSTLAKGKFRVWVRDAGEGIPLPEQKRIFERFARATNSRRRLEGCGLGLSIVKAIAEAHGGQVLLQSRLGVGSMFTLLLPLDPPQEARVHVPYPHRRR